jgi:hypothetical protein
MTFVLRIFFSGLIAFVPGSKGKELTVLLLNAAHGYHISDGSTVPEHKPLLLVRAGNCSGDCSTSNPDVAQYLFPDTSASQASDSLGRALRDGGLWELAGSNLTVVDNDEAAPLPQLEIAGMLPSSGLAAVAVPTTPAEREDFHWVADFNSIDPDGEGINPALLSTRPPGGLIAARLSLENGKVFTYRLVQIGGKVKPIHFQTLAGARPAIPYSQAMASWVEADIVVKGDNIEIVDQPFDGSNPRSMKLSPHKGVVELAILNLPQTRQPVLPPYARQPEAGRHFEAYYELAKVPPDRDHRPVPRADVSSLPKDEQAIDWDVLHPAAGQRSELLDALNLGAGKGPYDVILCPMIRF